MLDDLIETHGAGDSRLNYNGSQLQRREGIVNDKSRIRETAILFAAILNFLFLS